MLGERSGFVENYNPDFNDGSNFFSSSWLGLVGGSYFEGWRVVGWCAEPPNNNLVADINFYGFAKFSSAHPGVTNFAFCDGSVHSIPNDVPVETFRALGSIDGGEVIGEY